MSTDPMDADESISKEETVENGMDVCDASSQVTQGGNSAKFLSATPEKENQPAELMAASQSDCNVTSAPLSPAVTNANNFLSDAQNNVTNERVKSVWTVKSPMLVRPYSNSFTIRRKSQESYSTKSFEEQQETNEKPNAVLQPGRMRLSDTPPSAFTRKHKPLPLFMDVDLEGNMLKRCNSAPILNDPDGNSLEWNRPITSSVGRIRRFSANVVSNNNSAPANPARSRLRLHQLKKEESLEGIQNKEAEHEREVQATLQISSNCGDLTIGNRRASLDNSSSSPRSSQSPSSFPPRSHFPTPPSSLTAGKSTYSRAIDFNAPAAGAGNLPHTPTHHQPSGGIPSPLTFSASLSNFNMSPLPPSPTRGICGPGKQCFSPSMHIPACLARAASRSPSPSPTRRAFITRRRSQSPCIMRPSALGPIKRKCDSDSEGSSSPKRFYLPPCTNATTRSNGDTANNTNPSSSFRNLVYRSHSLSSSSVDSSDVYVSPSPPHQSTSFVTAHQHGNSQSSGFTHPLQYSLSPLSNIPTSQANTDATIRSSSPTSSTCSTSSLEGIRELQMLSANAQRHLMAPKKDPMPNRT